MGSREAAGKRKDRADTREVPPGMIQR